MDGFFRCCCCFVCSFCLKNREKLLKFTKTTWKTWNIIRHPALDKYHISINKRWVSDKHCTLDYLLWNKHHSLVSGSSSLSVASRITALISIIIISYSSKNSVKNVKTVRFSCVCGGYRDVALEINGLRWTMSIIVRIVLFINQKFNILQ